MAAQHGLTEGVVWKKRLGFFFPILLGLLFQQLYNTADAVIAGRFEGDSALAAVGGAAATIINMIIVMLGACVFRVLWILIAVPPLAYDLRGSDRIRDFVDHHGAVFIRYCKRAIG